MSPMLYFLYHPFGGICSYPLGFSRAKWPRDTLVCHGAKYRGIFQRWGGLLLKHFADRLIVMNPSNGFAQQWGDRQLDDFSNLIRLFGEGNGVGDDDF